MDQACRTLMAARPAVQRWNANAGEILDAVIQTNCPSPVAATMGRPTADQVRAAVAVLNAAMPPGATAQIPGAAPAGNGGHNHADPSAGDCGCGCGGKGKCKNGGGDGSGACNVESCDRPGSDDESDVPLVTLIEEGGDFNCRQVSSTKGPCEISKIIRTKRRFNVTAGTVAGTLVEATFIGDNEQLDTPAGYAWYRLVIDPIGLSHKACPRDFTVTLSEDGQPDALVTPIGVAVQVETLYKNGDGSTVFAWSYPKPEDPAYISISDGHCNCTQLCDCVPEDARFAIDLLLPELGVGQDYTVIAQGLRKCWGIQCMPEDELGQRKCRIPNVCDRETIPDAPT